MRLTYPLTDNIILVDNRGCAAMHSHETGEIFAQLANLLPLNKEVEWKRGFSLADRIVEAEPVVKSSDFIVPIFVYSVGCSGNPDEYAEIKKMLLTCRDMTGVVPTVVLTNKKRGNAKFIESKFKDMGIDNFFSLENYTPAHSSANTKVQRLVINFLFEVVKDAQFKVEHPRDPEKEMQDRKIFVLNYIHHNELELHIRNLQRQRSKTNEDLEETIRHEEEAAKKQQQEERRKHEENMRELEEEYKKLKQKDQLAYERKASNLKNPKKKSL
ncbi:uncharacterized protein [Hyperolius riggenbachi]|uniref:uncharacterized protein n=1 Tax=Hyperolius riggenbachi TaxID=752182 RepID=UPI0035A33A41